MEDAEQFVLTCEDPDQVVTVAVVRDLLKQKEENLQVAAGACGGVSLFCE